MVREEQVQYQQDRQGNERRKLDQLRGQAGMSGANGDDNGIVTIAAADTGSDAVAYSIPNSVDETILDLIHAHNSGDAAGTFRIKSATLNEDGSIDTTSRRSVLINVAGGVTRAIGYEGDPFTDDAIVVESTFEGEIGVAVLSDHKEYIEPSSENF